MAHTSLAVLLASARQRGTELKHVEKIPSEAVEARVAVELRDRGVDGDHVQRVGNVRRRR